MSMVSASSLEFRAWVDRWGSGLWNIIEKDLLEDETLFEEFVEILERVRRHRISEGRDQDLRRSSLFIREWIRKKARHQDRQAAEDRVFLVGMLTLGWDAEQIRVLMGGITASSLRYRLFEALKRASDLDPIEFRFRGRDCARFDLYAADRLLGLSWFDPLGYLAPAFFEGHQKECPRCRKIFEKMTQEVKILRDRSISMPPSDTLNELERLGLFDDARSARRWVQAWPWFVRLPLQLGLAAVIVFGVLALPYVGDFFPSVKRSFRTYREHIVAASRERLRQATAPQSPAVVATPAVVAQTEEASGIEEPLDLLAPATRNRPSEEMVLNDTPTMPILSPVAVPTVALAEKVPVPPVPLSSPTPRPSPTAVAAKIATPAPIPTAAPVKAGTWDEKQFYQWGAFTANLDMDTAQVVSILQKYDAKQEGSLKLGAPNRGGRYFHFSVSSTEFEAMQAEVQSLGILEFTEDTATSWRKTPMDRRRVVFLLRPRGGAPMSPNPPASSSEPAGGVPPADPAAQ